MSEQENLPVQDTTRSSKNAVPSCARCASKAMLPNDFQRGASRSRPASAVCGNVQGRPGSQTGGIRRAGRMMLKRVMGKASFATIQDMGGRIQLYITNEGVGEPAHEAFKHFDWAISGRTRHPVPHQDRRAVHPRH